MRLLLLLFCFLTFKGYSQLKQSFYFDFNKSEFTTTEKQKIENWIKLQPNLIVLRVEGFCDWVGNNPYNDKLSEKRVQAILKYLTGKVKIDEGVEKKAFGKRFEQDNNQDANRRVDVYFTYMIDVAVEPNEPVLIVKKNSLDSIVTSSKVGDKIKLKNLYFYNMSGNFRPESKLVLEELLQIMKSNPKLKIEVQGHICCEPNLTTDHISKVRALAVCKYLVENGIEEKRLQYKSFGSSQPIYKLPEKNDKERDANRRVELLILEK